MAKHAARTPLVRALPFSSVATVAAVAMIGAGAFAAWTSSVTDTTGSYSAATVTASEADHNSTTFTSAITNLLPADFAYRYRTLTNTGSVSQTFSAAVTGTGTLAGSGGLTVALDSCPVAWTTVATVSTCVGGSTTLRTAVGVSTSPTVSLGSVAASGAKYLRWTFALPSAADQPTFQGTSGTSR